MNKYILVVEGKVRAASTDLDTLIDTMLVFKCTGLEVGIYRLEFELIR